MSPKTQHQELQSLLGAYALDAVSPIESRRVAKHLETCRSCAHEVELLRATASELAFLPAPEDADELVERITEALPRRARRIVTRLTAGIAAVAIAIAGVLGASIVNDRSERRELIDVLATAQRSVDLRPEPGFEGGGRLYLAQERAALVLEHVPDPGRGKSYQLWAITGSRPVSMTVLGGGELITAVIDWEGRADVFAITIEPEGGSPVPTTDPVLAGS